MKSGKINLLALVLKKYNKLLNKQKILVFNNINYQIIILFGIITGISIFSDLYFQNNYLTITFIITTLLSSLITFISIPVLKKIKIKQIIREEGPKKHYLKKGLLPWVEFFLSQ
tara:strand:+ start:71 stop:412 length:342 start_codon:yes stop_codon:yes gene_type:complete